MFSKVIYKYKQIYFVFQANNKLMNTNYIPRFTSNIPIFQKYEIKENITIQNFTNRFR